MNLRRLRRGSLIVEYDVEYDFDSNTAADLTKANTDLVSGKEDVTLLNETVSAMSIQINNITVTNDTVNNADKVCELFIQSYGPCDHNYYCAVEEERPVCLPEKTSYGLSVVIAVTASVCVFLVCILIIICCSIRALRNRKLKQNPESLSTGSSGTEEHDWPNKGHIAPYGAIGGRQETPMVYLPYAGEVIQENRNYRKHRQDKMSGFSSSLDSRGHQSSHRTSHMSDRDRAYRYDDERKHNRKHLHNYGYDNRAMDYDQILANSYLSDTGYERR